MKIELNKGTRERLFHALIFEIVANFSIAFFLTWFIHMTVVQSGILTLISALTAAVLNYGFNLIIDRLQERYKFRRNFSVRTIHTLSFELMLITILTPLAMLLLNKSLFDAMFLETSLALFFLPYTIIYNWTYDYLRWIFIGRRLTSKKHEPQK